MQAEAERSVEILAVEDNPGDVALLYATLRGSKLRPRLHVVLDGVNALTFLRKEGRYRDSPRPDLVLLDLNLPKKSGHQVLSELKSDVALRGIPVVVLTSSAAEVDITCSYDLGANCFITKPVDLEGFEAMVQSIEHFWFTVVNLPAKR